jgi:Tfp pilus assembly protein PilZ
MNEKRVLKRSPIELAASYGIPEDLIIMREAKITNASFGGFSFFSKEQMKVGKTLQLAVEINNEEQAMVPVKVKWQKFDEGRQEYQVGVAIHHPKGKQYEKYVSYLAQRIDPL